MSRRIIKFELVVDTSLLPSTELSEEFESMTTSEYLTSMEDSVKAMVAEWFGTADKVTDQMVNLLEYTEKR